MNTTVGATPSGMTWQELFFPAKLDAELVINFVRVLVTRQQRGMLAGPDPLVVETVGTSHGLRWGLGASELETAWLLPHLRGQVPGLRLERRDERFLPAMDFAVELRLSNAGRSLRTDTVEVTSRALLTALADVHGDEVAVLSWLIGPSLRRHVIKTPASQPGGFLARLVSPPPDHNDLAALKVKNQEPLLGVAGWIGVSAGARPRQRQLAGRVLGALQLSRQPGVGLSSRPVSGGAAARRLSRLTTPAFGWPCTLNTTELATILGWPIGNPLLAGVQYRGGRQLPASPATLLRSSAAEIAPAGRYRIVGEATFPGREGLLQLSARSATQHLHVVGPTGSGKSALLARLIEHDIAAGLAVVVIEPKADLIQAVIDRLPLDRLDDVVLLDPTDQTSAVGLNLLAGTDPDLVTDQLLHVIRELNRDSWGPRTAQLLHAGLLTLARAGDATLAELPLLLTSDVYRSVALGKVNDPLGTAGVWAWFESLSEAERSSVIGPSLNKLGQFINRRSIRAIVGQAAPAFQMHQVFTERRVLLVNLAKGVIGPEAARLLGALVFSSLWQTALGRSAIAPERRHPVMVYVDEFQDYVRGLPLDFGEMLAQARGLGVGLHLAHQALHQLGQETRSSVLSDARSRIVFQTAGPDAKVLAASLGGGLEAADLQALGTFEAYSVLVAGGHPTAPASMRTLPPPPSLGRAERVRSHSREQWSRPIAEVEAAMLARRSPESGTQSFGGRRRRQP